MNAKPSAGRLLRRALAAGSGAVLGGVAITVSLIAGVAHSADSSSTLTSNTSNTSGSSGSNTTGTGTASSPATGTGSSGGITDSGQGFTPQGGSHGS